MIRWKYLRRRATRQATVQELSRRSRNVRFRLSLSTVKIGPKPALTATDATAARPPGQALRPSLPLWKRPVALSPGEAPPDASNWLKE